MTDEMTEDEARTEFVNVFTAMFLANWSALHYDTLSRRFGSEAKQELVNRAPANVAKGLAAALWDQRVVRVP